MTISDNSTSHVQRLAVWTIQVVVALAAFGWLLITFDVERAILLFTALDTAVLALVGGLTAVEFGTRYLMWDALLRERIQPTLRTVFGIDLVIKFINHLVPSKAAGHSIAPLIVRHYTSMSWPESITVAAANTGLYATLYGIVAGVSMIVLAPFLSWALLSVLALASGIYFVVGTSILLTGHNIGRVTTWLERTVAGLQRILPAAERVIGLLPELSIAKTESSTLFENATSRAPVVVPYIIGWLGTVFVIPGIRTGLLLWSFGAFVTPWWLVPCALLLGYSVTVLPITPGGIGVAEVSAALIFVALGVPEPIAALVILLDRTLGVYLPAILGWIPAARIDIARILADKTR